MLAARSLFGRGGGFPDHDCHRCHTFSAELRDHLRCDEAPGFCPPKNDGKLRWQIDCPACEGTRPECPHCAGTGKVEVLGCPRKQVHSDGRAAITAAWHYKKTGGLPARGAWLDQTTHWVDALPSMLAEISYYEHLDAQNPKR